MSLPEVVIFTPTAPERQALDEALAGRDFDQFQVRVVETGPGKLNTAARAAFWLAGAMAAGGPKPLLFLGVGSAYPLDMKLRAGEVVASASAVIGDWQMESDYARTYGPYGQPAYRALDAMAVEEMTLACPSPLTRELAARLGVKGFLNGRLLTTDTYVTGLSGKLSRGRLFGCLAGDAESGALAWVAGLYGRPWFNLRVVVETLDEDLRLTDRPDLDFQEIMALKTLVALSTLDRLPVSSGCAGCSGCGLGGL